MTPTPELREEVARVICCPSGVCGKGESPYAICQKHTFAESADAAIAAILAWVDREFVAIERLK